MSRRWWRRAAVVLVVLAASAPADPAASDATASEHRAARRTTIVFEVAGCDGCRLGVVQSRVDRTSETGVRMWAGPRAVVESGVATVTVPSARTRGMSVIVEAPDRPSLTSRTLVAFRLRGDRRGDGVTLADVRAAGRASGCWAGTDLSETTIPLVLHRAASSDLVAFASVAQPVLRPWHPVVDGVLAPRINICRA